MDYYCDVCFKYNKPNSKYSHFKTKSHQDFDKCKHIKLSIKNIDINKLDEAFHLYIIEHKKKFICYSKKCEFKLVFNNYEYCPYLSSKSSDSKTMIFWKNFLMKVIDDFKDKAYTSKQIAEMHIITKAKKMDKSYDFYIKHNTHAIELKLNAMTNKNKSLINKFNNNWRHLLTRKFEIYRV